jgi:hypothetical protein
MGGGYMKNKAVNITISSETKEQIKWMIDNSSVTRNRSHCIAICIDHVYKSMRKYAEEKEQREAKERIYNDAIEETVYSHALAADTFHSNHMPPKPKKPKPGKKHKKGK